MAEHDRQAVLAVYTDYFRAFQALNADEILGYYHTPCLFLSPQGVMVMASPAEGRALFADMMKGLAARGYEKSEWEDLGVRTLSETFAMLSTRVIRYATGGKELERFGATYSFRKTEGGWKIVVLAVHDADIVLDLG